MQETPLVLYYGPDATAITERWDRQSRPFDLRGLSAAGDVLGALTEDDVDCLVCAGGEDVLAVVDSGDATLAVDSELVVMADPGRLAQLLENRYRNALEHAADQTGPLSITVGDLREERGFFVPDDGVGIPEDEREPVFDAGFTTADDATGLGLIIVRTIADAHGWHVTVNDSVDGGACFQFENVHAIES